MDTRILMSILVIGVVAMAAGAGTFAQFSDTETSEGNTFTAGTIDLTVNDENPLTNEVVKLSGIKPCEEHVVWKKVTASDNPYDLYLVIKGITTGTGTMVEPECVAEGGTWSDGECSGNTAVDNIDAVTYYDLYLYSAGDDGECGTDDDELIKTIEDGSRYFATVATGSQTTPLKLGSSLEPSKVYCVKQSFHLDGEAGNEYQGDTASFTEEFIATQVDVSPPS